MNIKIDVWLLFVIGAMSFCLDASNLNKPTTYQKKLQRDLRIMEEELEDVYPISVQDIIPYQAAKEKLIREGKQSSAESSDIRQYLNNYDNATEEDIDFVVKGYKIASDLHLDFNARTMAFDKDADDEFVYLGEDFLKHLLEDLSFMIQASHKQFMIDKALDQTLQSMYIPGIITAFSQTSFLLDLVQLLPVRDIKKIYKLLQKIYNEQELMIKEVKKIAHPIDTIMLYKMKNSLSGIEKMMSEISDEIWANVRERKNNEE